MNGLGLDTDGNVYVTGQTDTNDFPVVAGLGLQNRRGQNNSAAIVTKIAAAGNALLYSTYLGGTRQEVGRGLAVDADGNAYVVGQTTSNDFPVVNAAQATHGSGDFNNDVFVAKLDADPAPALAYTPGNVFVSAVDYGEVREYTPTGTLVRTLSLPSGAFTLGSNPAGLAFDAAGHLFVADLVQNAVYEFDATGAFVGAFASDIVKAPQSLVFDAAGNLLVGASRDPNNVLEYDSGGNLLTQFDVSTHDENALWIDLAADQRTLFYTSNSGDIARYDLVTLAQGDDFFVEDIDGFRDFGVRVMPGGGALLAGRGLVRRLDATGGITKTYTPVPDAGLFQVSRDPDGLTLWTASEGIVGSENGVVIAFDIANANIVHQFTGVVPFDRPAIGGLAVFGELTEGRNGAPAGTPTPMPTRTPAPEVCDDCYDNDFDDAIDRNDLGDCPPPRADGLEQGLDPKTTGKAVVKCGKALTKAGNKLASSRQKHLQKCVGAAFACVQQKPNDAACTAKATATCAKEIGKLPGERTSLTAALLKACGPPALAVDDLKAAAGLGFGSETETCNRRGVTSLATANDVASCVLAEHACRAENLVGSQVPRAAELPALRGSRSRSRHAVPRSPGRRRRRCPHRHREGCGEVPAGDREGRRQVRERQGQARPEVRGRRRELPAAEARRSEVPAEGRVDVHEAAREAQRAREGRGGEARGGDHQELHQSAARARRPREPERPRLRRGRRRVRRPRRPTADVGRGDRRLRRAPPRVPGGSDARKRDTAPARAADDRRRQPALTARPAR